LGPNNQQHIFPIFETADKRSDSKLAINLVASSLGRLAQRLRGQAL
jgi:hypothetical protein